jgi:hypothetical protein
MVQSLTVGALADACSGTLLVCYLHCSLPTGQLIAFSQLTQKHGDDGRFSNYKLVRVVRLIVETNTLYMWTNSIHFHLIPC